LPLIFEIVSLFQNAVLSFFGSEPSVKWFLTPDGFESLLALVGRNGQGVGTSPLSQWVKKVEKLSLKNEEKEYLDKVRTIQSSFYQVTKSNFNKLCESKRIIFDSLLTEFMLK